MKLAWMFGAVAALSMAAVGAASAGVEFGRPDFSNGLSRPGLVCCNWSYDSYFRACPTPQLAAKACCGAGQRQAQELTMRRRMGARTTFDAPRLGRPSQTTGELGSSPRRGSARNCSD